MFFKKKKQKNEYQVEKTVTEVALTTLARWYAYDTGLEDPNDVAKVLGMLPTSSEGLKLEEDESEKRLSRVVPLIPLIETIADINAQAVAALQLEGYSTEMGVDLDTLQHEQIHIEDLYRQIGFSALVAALSAGIELGIIGTSAVGGALIHGE